MITEDTFSPLWRTTYLCPLARASLIFGTISSPYLLESIPQLLLDKIIPERDRFHHSARDNARCSRVHPSSSQSWPCRPVCGFKPLQYSLGVECQAADHQNSFRRVTFPAVPSILDLQIFNRSLWLVFVNQTRKSTNSSVLSKPLCRIQSPLMRCLVTM
ncbi:hypothetical protein BDN72DRAFT_410340 [Pluteus cervinus]|uniref:Uncharacterized protein n=1 Tax=Pluteus cervinus TaxID=181527 RepID=A0ACD3B2J5_9AGAR|nr:hypothetical protein BDN72DRAFT_410340 [Pluteus cervinus]